MAKLSLLSERNLIKVHPNLVRLIRIGILGFDFRVIDGVRTIEEQKVNVAKGVSQTMNSKHLPQEDGFSHAVDLIPCTKPDCEPNWNSPAFIEQQRFLGYYMKGVAVGMNLHVVWGGDWKSFVDMPHFQLVT